MKNRFVWMLVPALVLGAVSCKEKDGGAQTPGKEAPAKVSEDPAGTDPAGASDKALSAGQRAKVVGFAGHLPADVEYLISIHDGEDATRRVKASKAWKTFAEMSGMPADEIADEVVMGGPADMFGVEYTLAMGKGTSEQLRNLDQAKTRGIYYLMTGLIKLISHEIAAKESGEPGHPMSLAAAFLSDFIQDEKSGVGLLEKTEMPPMYIAFKTTDEKRAVVNQQIASGLQFLTFFQEMVKPVTADRGDSTFNGYQIIGAKIAEQLEQEKADMEEVMPSATADRLIAALAEKNLFLVSGIHGEYVVLFIGASLDDMRFADDAASSLAGGSALEFIDAYAEKDLYRISYGHPEGFEAVVDLAKGWVSDVGAGIRNGLAQSDQFGDTRNIDALLLMVEEREAELEALAKVHGGGTVAFFDEGLRVESYGGYDSGYADWDADNQLAVLGTQPGVMLFANVTSNVEYDTKMRAYIEALFETSYACAMKMTELPIEDSDMVEFKGHMENFDTKFRADLLTFWHGFSNGFSGGLGQERALVVDLEGAMPAFPGIPQEVVDSGKFPRITWIAPVEDRTKLGAAWAQMNSSMTNMAATISEMLDKEIPMQKPLSSDKDENKTWFFPLPFFSDDFLPSVTVNDKWFAASTSKLQAVDLIEKAEAGGKATQGFVMKADFTELHDYATEMMALAGKNADELDLSEYDLKQANKMIEAFSEIDSMNIHVRREDGLLRSSFHFKVVGE